MLVNAAIKKELCRIEGKQHFAWMAKVRPWYGHDDHIHVRLKCPADSPNCRKQPPVPGGDGCGAKELAFWFKDMVLHPKPGPPPSPAQAAHARRPAAGLQDRARRAGQSQGSVASRERLINRELVFEPARASRIALARTVVRSR